MVKKINKNIAREIEINDIIYTVYKENDITFIESLGEILYVGNESKLSPSQWLKNKRDNK